MNKYLSAALLLTAFAQNAAAQSGTNSPYSQFGLGLLSDQSTGFNRGMNGVGLGFHDGNQVNTLNPASYAYTDSLSFIFDAGVAGQLTHFKEGNTTRNIGNANFEYVVASFRAFRHLGMSFGILPYTTVGYSYSISQNVNDADQTIATSSYSGSGGLHQVYLGIGWEPLRGLAIGVNGSYLFGGYTRTLSTSYSNIYANTLTRIYSSDVRNYKLDFGAQYTARLSKNDALTIGATYGMGHKIGGDPKLDIISLNSQTAVSDTTSFSGSDGNKLELEIPTTITAGLMYQHGNSFKLGVDYSLQKWGSVESPVYGSSNNGAATYTMQGGTYKDRHKVALGVEWCPRGASHNLAKRIHYRAGIGYATPYYYINGQDGPKEMSASIGFGIPIMNNYNNRSILNISAQWVNQSVKNMITDNSFRLTIGLTFNERWFAKWKVD